MGGPRYEQDALPGVFQAVVGRLRPGRADRSGRDAGTNGIAGDDDGTDPNLADTDEDTTNDETEINRGSDPLTKDKYVRFTFVAIHCVDADDEGASPIGLH